MKNNGFLFCCCVLLICTSDVYAQKQGKVEKLYKYLFDGETDKLIKNREKLDDKTAGFYSAEVGLLDNIHALLKNNDVDAIPAYFDNYVKADEKALKSIGKEAKINIDELRNRVEKKILTLLEESPEKFSFSLFLIEEIRKTNYPMKEEGIQTIIDTRETELVSNLETAPNIPNCMLYYDEFPDGKYEKKVKETHNTLLYGAVVNDKNDRNFKLYFDESSLNDYYGGLDRRPYCGDIRKIYAEYLFALIENSKEPQTAKENRNSYATTPYLREADRIHQDRIGLLLAKIDYEWLKANLQDETNIHLLKTFLREHPYREFRDKVIKLRDGMEKEVIWSNPTDMRFYHAGKIMKSNEVGKDKMIANTYTYNGSGKLESISTVIEENQKSNELLTHFLYDINGRLIMEEQIYTKTQKPVYTRVLTYSPSGVMLSDSTIHDTGILVTREYDGKGRVVAERDIDPKVENPLKLVTYTYNDQGDILVCEHSYSYDPEKILPHTTRYQKDVYEYDKYGYLTRIKFEKVVGREGQTNTGSLIFLYDEYGNPIDSNSYYEYDKAGRWVRKTNRDNPEDAERVMVTYR